MNNPRRTNFLVKARPYISIAGSIVVFFHRASIAYAQPIISINNYSRFSNLGEIFSTVINILLTLISVLAVGAIIYGGYRYITSSGNPDSVAMAKSTITWAIVGLILAFASYVIVDFVMRTISG